MIRFRRWAAACGFIVSVLANMPCRAAFIEVDIVSAVMTAGSSGYVDVIIRGTGAPITGFGYTIEISGGGPGTGNVVFTAPVNDEPGIGGTGVATPYVFYNESDGIDSQIVSSSEVFGSDFWAPLDVSGKILDQDYLLARLNIEHQGELDINLAEAVFTLSVTQASFLDADGLLYDDSNPAVVQLGSGTLKIVATPEPATLGGLGLAALVVVRGVKRRRGPPAAGR